MSFSPKIDICRLLQVSHVFAWVWLLGLLQPASAQNNALHFDGNNDYVVVPDNDALDVSSAFTIECWVYRTAHAHNTLVAKWDDDVNQRGYMLNFGEHDPSTLSVLLNNNGYGGTYLEWNSGVSVPLNTWTHIAVTLSETWADNVKVYKDGVLGGQTTWSFTVHTSITNLYIGGYDGPNGVVNAGADSRYFAGSIDDLRIWNVARSATEIADNYQCPVAGSASGLVALYDFNQGTAGGSNTAISSLTDATPNALHGTLTNFAKTGTRSNLVAGVTTGVASISIVSDDSDNTLCNSTNATFTAAGIGAASGTTYQWYRGNSGNVADYASVMASITMTGLANSERISCVMISQLACLSSGNTATSNQIILSVLGIPT